jgi:uncharacterized cupredoxin-like copper-binding protein
VKVVAAVCTLLVATVAIAIVTLAGSEGASGDDAPPVRGPGPVTVRVVVRDSKFLPSGRSGTEPPRIHVKPHTDVRFVVVNRDFINHEFIVGGEEVHTRHEGGHEPWHPRMPGEVSVSPHTTGETSYSFHAPGKVLYACHLPGHFAYGMKGYVVVDRA